MKKTSHPFLEKGATMIAVFWIMAVMGLALVASLRIARYQSSVAGSQMNGMEALQFAEMGLAVAANPQVKKWDFILNQNFGDDTGFQAKIVSEGGRFNINYILMSDDKPLIRLILAEWGVAFDQQGEIADALVDWIDSDGDVQLNGAELEYYEGQGYLNRPFNRPFYDLDEMRLVRGMNYVEAANPRWRDWFTVWSSGGLDISQAAPEFLAIAAEGNVEDAYSIREIVNGADGILNTEDDQPLPVGEAMSMMGMSPDEQGEKGFRFSSGNEVTERIESIGYAGAVRRKVVLIIRNREQGRPTILDRKEETIQ